MVKEGFPFVIVPAVIALLFAFLQIWVVAALFVAIALFMAYFFRDPHRVVPDRNDVVVSAADGKVTRIDNGDVNRTFRKRVVRGEQRKRTRRHILCWNFVSDVDDDRVGID